MKPHMIKNPLKIATIIVFVITFFCIPISAFSKSFFWEVKSPTTTIYLLGSIHFAKPDLYPLDMEIEAAFAKASTLVVELDNKKIDQSEMRRLILKKGMYEKSDSIENHIGGDTLTALKDHLNRYDMPLEGYSKMKPGFLAMTLSVAHVYRMGYVPDYGIDMYFLNKAQGKTVLQLENYQDQIELFFDMPNEELFLKDTILQLATMEEQINDIVHAWKQGDTNALTKQIIIDPQKQHPELQLVYDQIYTHRNYKMAAKIEDYLKNKDIYFVVVGAGHLIGEQGIVSILSKNGYKITQY